MIKWVVRLAFIAVLLGFVGTIAIILHLHYKQEDKKSVAEQKTEHPIIKNLKSDSAPPPVPALQLTVQMPKDEKKDPALGIPEAKNKSSEEISETPVKKIEVEKKALHNTIADVPDSKPITTKKPNKISLLNPFELKQLVRQISIAKLKTGNYSKCVQVYITGEAYNKKILSQVEKYLKKQRFTIAGREVVDTKVKGIRVRPGTTCTKITIGTF